MNIVITGANRGIGLELVRVAASKGHSVLAIAREPDESTELIKLKNQYDSIQILKLDLAEKEAHLNISNQVREWPAVDLVVNNAGIYQEHDNLEDFEKSFLINTITPFLITRELLPKLKKSKRPVSLQITSQMGSIEDNSSGSHYSYRASKAALNMIFKSISIDEPWLISLLIHPGWVQTRMGGAGATTTVADSVSGMWKIFEDAKLSDSGKFLDFRGQSLPW